MPGTVKEAGSAETSDGEVSGRLMRTTHTTATAPSTRATATTTHRHHDLFSWRRCLCRPGAAPAVASAGGSGTSLPPPPVAATGDAGGTGNTSVPTAVMSWVADGGNGTEPGAGATSGIAGEPVGAASVPA